VKNSAGVECHRPVPELETALEAAQTAADQLGAEVVRLTVELGQTRRERDDAERRLAATVDELTDAQAAARAEGVAAERERWRRMTTVQVDTARGFW
jgi:predicted  nucleic acid-binding Zn-ribbon protein